MIHCHLFWLDCNSISERKRSILTNITLHNNANGSYLIRSFGELGELSLASALTICAFEKILSLRMLWVMGRCGRCRCKQRFKEHCIEKNVFFFNKTIFNSSPHIHIHIHKLQCQLSLCLPQNDHSLLLLFQS